MSTVTLLNPQTAATANEPSLIIDTADYDNVMLFATGLAGAETVPILIIGGGADIPLSAAGVAVTLTATQPHVSLQPGPTYRVTKGVTAGAAGIYVALDA